ncbi:redoxin family protein [Pedobacter gandavensis]|uniref:Redoxin family protein n=1 Tax=Pedobacter gandavensis TaxID=2679963 RepID=A0ABR6ES49_9SPHI|nr:redoxin family protein [Pedobacter gandavensis]MBB2148088.1 redoxin family protein [Pedobacter gandavensis]
MKTVFFYFFLLTLSIRVAAQGLQIKNGDQFPNIPIQNLLNAPTKSFSLTNKGENKFYILNFWGTWCSPCIPEMDNLAKLQNKNMSKMQVIAIADDEPNRLLNYLKKKPSKLWLASDTSATLYQLFGFAYVGQSAVVNAKGKVIALVKTDSINQAMIDQLAKGITVKSTAELKEKPVSNQEDLFAVDSTVQESFSIRSYMIGQQAMSKRYSLNSIYNNRRITFINSTILSIYRQAYHIVSPQQIAYEIPEKEVSDYNNKQSLYCLDLLIKPNSKDSLYQILQQKLPLLMPVKARIEFREMPVYALVNKGFHQEESAKTALSYSFSGKGYESEGASLEEFANDYLSNEFELPVVDETGLTKRYDIKTNVILRDRNGILKSIHDIGLDLVKKTKAMKVLVFYK